MRLHCIMGHKSFRHIILTYVAPVALAGAMLVTAVDLRSFIPGEAQASTSLPGIETIKNNIREGSAFNILEVTPKSAADDYNRAPAMGGSFGYLISGQEPVNIDKTLTSVTEYKDDDSSTGFTGHNKRTEYANNLIKGLVSAKIASTNDDSAPLKVYDTNDSEHPYYKELWPWEDDVDDEKTLDLGVTEIISLKNLTAQPDANGAFNAGSTSFALDENGAYVQNITSENPMTQISTLVGEDGFDKSDYIFYKLKITEKSVDDIIAAGYGADTPLFSRDKVDDEGETPAGWSYDALATERKLFDGNKEYAIADSTYAEGPVFGKNFTIPLADSDDYSLWFAAKMLDSNPFRAKNEGEKGYFRFEANSFTYVGKGRGAYSLTVNPADIITDSSQTSTKTIEYSSIRYIGGYRNNNWFLRFVLDFDEATDDELKSLSSLIHVNYVKPEDVRESANEAAGQDYGFDKYGMYVLSCGFDASGSEVKYGKDDAYKSLNNSALQSGLTKALKATDIPSEGNKPVFVDWNAANDSAFDGKNNNPIYKNSTDSTNKDSHIGQSVALSDPNGAVQTSVYVFKRTDDCPTMASSGFDISFDASQYKGKNLPFSEVYEEITYENSLRTAKGLSGNDLLTDKVGESDALRYIINYSRKRNAAHKSSIRVLDIEPEEIGTLSSDSNTQLKNNIIKWLNAGATSGEYNNNNVTVTTVSTRTLSGLTDEMSETYDMIYIGDRNKKMSYRDAGMNGLAYYNIGDTYYASNENYVALNGVLDSEYTTSKGSNNVFRYSGNDITEKKQKELESFIQQGLPVVVSDDMLLDTSYNDFSFRAGFSSPYTTYDKVTDTVTLHVGPVFTDASGKIITSIKNIAGNEISFTDIVKCRYQWYQVDQNGNDLQEIPSATDSSYEVPKSEMHNKYFICKMTGLTIGSDRIEFNDVAQPKSNRIMVGTSILKFRQSGNDNIWDQGNDYHAVINYNNNSNYWVKCDTGLISDGSELIASVGSQNLQNLNIPGVKYNWYTTIDNKKIKENSDTIYASECNIGKVIYAMMETPNGSKCSSYRYYEVYEDTNEKGGRVVSDDGTLSNTVNADSSVIKKPSTVTIDANTRLYETIKKFGNRDNLMSVSRAANGGDTLISYASLSTPKIEMAKAPAQYSADIKAANSVTGQDYNEIGGYDKDGKKIQEEKVLDYEFQIVNETEIDQSNTTYTARVYADINSDGVYKESDGEEIYDLTVKRLSSKGDTEGSQVRSDSLEGGGAANAPYYRLIAQLPEGLQGAFSWKLIVTKNVNEDDVRTVGTQDSYKGVSFVGLNQKTGKDDLGTTNDHRIKINVLQFNSDSNYDFDHEDGKSSTVQKFYDQLKESYKRRIDGVNYTVATNSKTGWTDDLNTCGSFFPYDLQALMAYPNVQLMDNEGKLHENYFGQYLNSDFVKKYYNLKITTIKASQADEYFAKFPTWKKDYNMLLLGFGDNYNGLSRDAMKQVKSFIGMGKSVLFCHDNSSYRNLNKYNTGDNSGKTYSGYHTTSPKQTSAFDFNTLLRSQAYMDVYGISDIDNKFSDGTTFGGQVKWSYTTDKDNDSNQLKDEYGHLIHKENIPEGKLAQLTDGSSILSEKDQKTLKDQHYSVAYKPQSGKNDKVLVSQIHGYTDYATAFRRQHDNDGALSTDAAKDNMDNLKTNTVSQINKGQITTYPYDINAGEFKTSDNDSVMRSDKNKFTYTGAKAVMGTSQTHGQWYQLNMNADNIVVWYTVDDDDKKDFYGYNDCTNNYYIFNCGNITYTGAGHSNGGTDVTAEEAKLFVNTMIAAYRPEATAPVGKFVTSANNDTEITTKPVKAVIDLSDSKTDEQTSISNTMNSSEGFIYFTLRENNMASNKYDYVEFYQDATRNSDTGAYTVNGMSLIDNVAIYDAQKYSRTRSLSDSKVDSVNESGITRYKLKSGKTYFIQIPGNRHTSTSVYGKLLADGKADIYMRPSVKIGSGNDASILNGVVKKLHITLGKQGLFMLG